MVGASTAVAANSESEVAQKQLSSRIYSQYRDVYRVCCNAESMDTIKNEYLIALLLKHSQACTNIDCAG